MKLQKLLVFPLEATANICNVGLMRHTELSEGIDVLDDNGKVVGSSKTAARHVSGLVRVVAKCSHFCR